MALNAGVTLMAQHTLILSKNATSQEFGDGMARNRRRLDAACPFDALSDDLVLAALLRAPFEPWHGRLEAVFEVCYKLKKVVSKTENHLKNQCCMKMQRIFFPKISVTFLFCHKMKLH